MVYKILFTYMMPDGGKGSLSYGPAAVTRGSFVSDTGSEASPGFDGDPTGYVFLYINSEIVDPAKVSLVSASVTGPDGRAVTPRASGLRTEGAPEDLVYYFTIDDIEGENYTATVTLRYSDNVGGASVVWDDIETVRLSFPW